MIALLAPLLLLSGLAGPGPGDGEAVVRAAHQMYAGKWFRTMTFVQKTTFPGRPTQTWYEAMELPGKLRLDIAPSSAGRATIFRNDSVYSFSGGTLRSGQPYVHSMLVLLGDVRVLPPEATIAKLKAQGFDLSVTHETTWHGEPVIVVGAAAGDTTSRQFWIEKKRMLLVRLIEPAGADRLMDAHFGKYTQHGDAWVEGEILIHMNGALAQGEEYTAIRTGVTHEAGLFEPSAALRRAGWIGDGAVRW